MKTTLFYSSQTFLYKEERQSIEITESRVNDKVKCDCGTIQDCGLRIILTNCLIPMVIRVEIRRYGEFQKKLSVLLGIGDFVEHSNRSAAYNKKA